MSRFLGSVRRQGQGLATICNSYGKILATRQMVPHVSHPAPFPPQVQQPHQRLKSEAH